MKLSVVGATIAAVFMGVLTIALSVRIYGLRGPGPIVFGTALARGRVLYPGSVFGPADKRLVFRARLQSPGDIRFGLVSELFQVQTAHGWSNVAWLYAPANPAKKVLEHSYSRRRLDSAGVKAPGVFRLLILAPLGVHQAVGVFRLLS